MKKGILVLGAIMALGLITSCSSGVDEQDSSTLLASYVGKPWSDLSDAVPDSVTFAVQDLSVVVDEEPSYNSSMFGSTRWVVAAACGSNKYVENSSDIAVALLPLDSVTPDVERLIEQRKYDSDIACGGLTHRG